ncbi:Aspartate or glutamate racemase [Klebsormidium nitens]|uniref:Aspartate or glutamate racemase n=1 Tax=Klebsormidium nitens TaxID=105231 RepID=A0A1Y1ID49_KLENI|nr:Aspartate or glutamate racemase [Klebsormidium nitens]|eukprot:GAQ87369.1 Aspartate or glutamate racemase [Klebsormidium nitens]
MSALQRVPHKSAVAPFPIDLLTAGVGWQGSDNLFLALGKVRNTPQWEHKARVRKLLYRCIGTCRVYSVGERQLVSEGVEQRAPGLASGARSREQGRKRTRANASESSGARSGPEDEVTLGDRLNAISHRKPLPGVNGTAAQSRGFSAAAAAAESNDPSLPQSRFRSRALPEPSHAPPVVKVSNRHDVVGVLGGISPRATADFMRQVIQATPANSNKDHIPLVVSSIPQIPSLSAPILNRPAGPALDQAVVSPLPAMLETRRFLEQSGARCIVMPSNMAHFWYDQLALDCSVPFLHIADAVVEELDLAKLEPLEAGSRPKVGLLASEATLKASIYQQKLEARGYTVVLPDRDTMAHAVLPGMEALERGDNEGAKNLLGIGVQMLLVNAVNVVILAFSEASSVFPPSDPILKRCLSPTAALARATVRWVLKTRADATPGV